MIWMCKLIKLIFSVGVIISVIIADACPEKWKEPKTSKKSNSKKKVRKDQWETSEEIKEGTGERKVEGNDEAVLRW